MSDEKTFLALALRGEIFEPVSAIDDYIDRWHEEDNELPLHEWLGMTWDEYSLVVRNPKYLRAVLASRASGMPIESSVAALDSGFAMAARGDTAAAELREWAKNRH